MSRISDDQVLAALGQGGRTWQVARALHWHNGTNLARRYLQRLEKSGRVKRDSRYSVNNDIYWIPVS